jgi:exonuclease SbcC
MSALELALSGAVSGIEPEEEKHFIHRGADEALIELVASEKSTRFAIDEAGIHGDPLLTSHEAHFLRERCYLQQRSLGRLLELYEEAPKGGEAPLAEFVNDLLGIDELDTLIDGLRPVGDKRRVKKLIPAYRDLEDEIQDQHERIQELAAELEEGRSEAANSRARLDELLRALQPPPALDEDYESIKALLQQWGAVDEDSLVDLVGTRRELSSLTRRAASLTDSSSAVEIAPLEARAAKARADASAWRASDGSALEELLDSLRKTLPGISAVAGSADPTAICVSALEAVDGELSRLNSALLADEQGRGESARFEEAIVANQRRLVGIDEQMAGSTTATSAEELARSLAALIPHVHSDDCPVCGRDYSEVAGEPLSARLAARVSELGAQAERLQESASARLEVLTEQRNLEGRLVDSNRKQMEPEAMLEARAVVSRLETARRRLTELQAGAVAGAALIREQTEAERDLSMAREKDRTSIELRSEVEELAALLEQPAPAAAATPAEAIEALSDHVGARISALEERAAKRASAEEILEASAGAVKEQRRREADLADRRAATTRAEAARDELERRRQVFRHLSGEAEQARQQIVRQVFTETLNRAWRDLFVRLAPEEPFVPAFRVPESTRGVTAVLETMHRDGKPGGSPAAMLSAGNLNTAALTLFLALNLSVSKRLPWLLLDDPVQSMDELHIAQFAALLRTLTRGHARHIVLAVHERALFEYLSLELSPGTGSDEGLVTVELTRGPDGSTLAETHFQTYEEDHAFASV